MLAKFNFRSLTIGSLKSSIANSLIPKKNFGSGHGHGHGTDVEEEYHERKYNRVSYNIKLSESERERILGRDYLNETTTDWIKQKHLVYVPKVRYEVMVPHETIRADREELLLDRTEIQARIYNLLRQFDFKPLEEIDFDSDYEKELGLDSLEWTALITSIEHEFHTVFEDTIYEHLRTINDFVGLIEKDFSCF